MFVSKTVQHDEHPAVVEKLSLLDRLLPIWIGTAMAAGLLLGRLVPGLDTALDSCPTRRYFAAYRHRPAGDDVPGAGEGSL